MPLTERIIQTMSANSAIFARGKDYYRNGRARITALEQADAAIQITAVVHGSQDRPYDVEVWLHNDSMIPFKGSCDCPAFSQYSGLCKHMVAALLCMIHQPLPPLQKRTDKTAHFLLQQYATQHAQQVLRYTEDAEQSVRLAPILDISAPHGPTLRLKVGRQKLYVVKSYMSFYSAMHSGEHVVYGKEFEWIHTLESVAAKDQPLLRLILEYCAALSRGSGYAYGNVLHTPELPLTPPLLDRFFALMEGRPIAVRWGDRADSTLPLLDRDVQLPLTLAEVEGGISLHSPALPHLLGADRLYVLTPDAILRTSSDCLRRLQPLLCAMERRPLSCFLAEQELSSFFSGMLASIRPYVQLLGDTEKWKKYQPLSLEARLHLDAPAVDTLTCRLTFDYGSFTVNPNAKDNPTARRDMQEEMRVELLTRKHFNDQKDDHFVLQGDDATLYSFLVDSIPALAQLGDVFVSERLKKFECPPPPKVNLSVSLDSNLLDVALDISGFPLEELSDVLTAYQQRRKYYRLKGGQFLSLDNSGIADLAELAQGAGLTAKELAKRHFTLPAYRAMYLDAVLQQKDAISFERSAAFKSLVRGMKNIHDSQYEVPESLRSVLRNYQKTGYRWLRTLTDGGFHGILADDMGLGKTLQIIALLLSAKQQNDTLQVLIVCPASVVLNWKAEMQRFAPALRVTALSGGSDQRAQQIGQRAQVDVLVTSYDQLKRDIPLYEGATFDFQVLDEAQVIKNAHTLGAKAAKAIDALHRFALTGTPIENRLSELWSIFDFLMPGYFFSYAKFRERYELPAMKQQDQAALAQVRRMAAPFMLRRMKSEVLTELPPKTESVRKAVLSGEQKKLYLANMLLARQEIQKNVAENTLRSNKLQILAMLTRLRQICCDPRLCLDGYTRGSAKLELCLELVQEAVGSGHKILLFSQFTSMLELLRQRLAAEKLSHYLLQGSTSKEQRAQMIQNFNTDDTSVFLISLKAGGLGVNLTGADVVIHYDPWWNTAAQNQATDRAYRMGQAKSVQVYKLIAQDTIEEKILELQQRKQDLADSVVAEGNALAAMDERDWLALLDG